MINDNLKDGNAIVPFVITGFPATSSRRIY